VSAELVFDRLEPVLTRWTMGGPAAGLAPPEWHGATTDAEASDSELRLLALTGQFLGLCVAPTSDSALTAIPDIPALGVPSLPAAQSALARRCLKAMKDSGEQHDLIHLLAARGYAIHPADWMPSRDDDAVPDIYAPWRDWAERRAAGSVLTRDPHDALTEANWSDWWPAARRNAFADIRTRDPARATALLAAKASGEAADARLRLIECLIPGLSDADAPYLESLATDRAPKIKALAVSLLARLGRVSGAGEDAAELAGFFDIQAKGLLRRTRVLVPRPMKTLAQRSRREALFDQVSFEGLASELGLSVADLVALWSFGSDAQADHGLAAIAVRTAPAPLIDALWRRLMAEATIDVSVILALRPRLDGAQKRDFARRVIAAKGGSFASALAIAGAGADLNALIDTYSGQMLLGALTGDGNITFELRALALIASQPAARDALDRFVRAGLSASDPRLDLLRLNAALNHVGENA
jgi:hypothetical protein